MIVDYTTHQIETLSLRLCGSTIFLSTRNSVLSLAAKLPDGGNNLPQTGCRRPRQWRIIRVLSQPQAPISRVLAAAGVAVSGHLPYFPFQNRRPFFTPDTDFYNTPQQPQHVQREFSLATPQ